MLFHGCYPCLVAELCANRTLGLIPEIADIGIAGAGRIGPPGFHGFSRQHLCGRRHSPGACGIAAAVERIVLPGGLLYARDFDPCKLAAEQVVRLDPLVELPAAIGVAGVVDVGLGKVAPVVPCRRVESEGHPVGIGAGRRGKHPVERQALHERILHLPGVGLLQRSKLLEGVLPDEIGFRRFLLEGADGGDRPVDERKKMGNHIANDAAGLDGDIDPRPRHGDTVDGDRQLVERREGDRAYPAARLPHRPDPHEGEDLGEQLAVGLEGVGAPEAHADAFGKAALFAIEFVKQHVSHRGSDLPGRFGGHGHDVGSVEIPAGREHVRLSRRRSVSETRFDVASGKSPDHVAHFVAGAPYSGGGLDAPVREPLRNPPGSRSQRGFSRVRVDNGRKNSGGLRKFVSPGCRMQRGKFGCRRETLAETRQCAEQHGRHRPKRRRLTEEMHPLRNHRKLQQRHPPGEGFDLRMQLGDRCAFRQKAQSDSEIEQLLLQGFLSRRLPAIDRSPVFAQQFVVTLQFRVQDCRTASRGEMIDDDRATATFGHHPLSGRVHDIGIDVRQVAERNVAEAVSGEHRPLAGKIFERAARPEMDDGVALLLYPEIGRQPVVRRRYAGIVQDTAHLPVTACTIAATFRLRHNQHLAEPEPGNEQGRLSFDFERHALSGKNAPLFVHLAAYLFVEGAEPGLVLLPVHGVQDAPLSQDPVSRCPAELKQRLPIMDHGEQVLPGFGKFPDVVPFVPHPPQEQQKAFEGIESCRHADGALDSLAGIVVQDECDALFAVRRMAQTGPALHPLHDHADTLRDGNGGAHHWRIAGIANRSGHHDRVDGAEHFRLHQRMGQGHGADADGIVEPLLGRKHEIPDKLYHRHVEILQHPAIFGRRDQAPEQEVQDDVGGQFA